MDDKKYLKNRLKGDGRELRGGTGWLEEGHYAEEWLDSGCEDEELREFWEV